MGLRGWQQVREWWGYPSAHVHRAVEVVQGPPEWTEQTMSWVTVTVFRCTVCGQVWT